MPRPELSIIIVNWNSAEYLHRCLGSIFSNCRGLACEVLVADNGSYDGCAEVLAQYFPQVHFLQLPNNLGFAAANNLAVAFSTGRNLLFLNPDTEVVGDALHRMLDALAVVPDAGIIGPRLVGPDFSPQWNCMRCVPSLLNQLVDSSFSRRMFPIWWGFDVVARQSHEPIAAQVVPGTCLIVRRFGNPVSAGVFGATLMPLSLALWWKGHKHAPVAGFCAASIIVACSLSSTPVLAYTVALLGLCLWPLRRHLPLLRWSTVIALLGLQLVMNAPVWALIQRAGVIGGSSGYHRYILVDRFFRHFGDWWLLGTRNAGDWGYLSYDIANQYVGIGESAGLVPFVLFIAIIVYAFKYLGRARAAAGAANDRRFLWAIGCALLAHVIAFFGLSYFDQLIVAWYALLAIISAVAMPSLHSTVTAPLTSPAPV